MYGRRWEQFPELRPLPAHERERILIQARREVLRSRRYWLEFAPPLAIWVVTLYFAYAKPATFATFIVSVASLTAAVLHELLRRRAIRRAVVGKVIGLTSWPPRCRWCGYDLRAIQSDQCPE